MSPAGYTYEVIGENLKDLRCPVCKHLIKDCVELPCGHCMCKNCIEQLNEQAAEKNEEPTCPTCNAIYKKESVKESKAMDRIIRTSVRIKCPQVQLGCDWQGEISNLESHEEICEYKMVACENDGCDGVVMRCNLDKHMDICEYRIGFCDHCSLELQINELKEHCKTCDYQPVSCPNAGCKVEDIIKKELADHLSKDCMYQEKPCQLKHIGCKDLVKNSNIRKHFDESIYEHTHMLLNHSSNLYKLWNDTKQDLEETNTNLAKTTAVLMETLKKLAETRKNLIATQDDLEASKAQLSGNVEPTIINNNNIDDEKFNEEMKTFRKELENLKQKQVEEAALRRQEEKKREKLEEELKKMREERAVAEAKTKAAEEAKDKAIAEVKAKVESEAKERAAAEIKAKAANEAIEKALAEAKEAKETAAAQEKELIRLKEAQTVAAARKPAEVVMVSENKNPELKRTPPHKRSTEELREATAHIAYPKKALPPEPLEKQDEANISDNETDSPMYSKVNKLKKKVVIAEPEKENTAEPKDTKTDTLGKKAKKVSIVEPVKDGEGKDVEDGSSSKKTEPEVAKVEPIRKEPTEPIIKKDSNSKDPVIAKGVAKEEPKQLQPIVKPQPQQPIVKAQTQQPMSVKPNGKRPNSPLQALVDGLNTDSNVIYCDSYYALMIKLETDRFYRINGDMYVKINTRGLLRPYDLIYLQPWEERDRLSFQELQYNRRIMHYTDRVAIEVGSKTAIVKLLAGCTTNSATAAILHTQQSTSFLPAFIDKWGWGYNVPVGNQRATFYSQDHILVRIRKRSMSRDDMFAGF